MNIRLLIGGYLTIAILVPSVAAKTGVVQRWLTAMPRRIRFRTGVTLSFAPTIVFFFVILLAQLARGPAILDVLNSWLELVGLSPVSLPFQLPSAQALFYRLDWMVFTVRCSVFIPFGTVLLIAPSTWTDAALGLLLTFGFFIVNAIIAITCMGIACSLQR
jgi:hypothetical protein